MELWSGVIGASLSAVLAALVAVFVVWRTNKHQTRLSAIARSEAYEQSQAALRSQRELLQKQLVEQRQRKQFEESVNAISAFMLASEELLVPNLGRSADDVIGIRSKMVSCSTMMKLLGPELAPVQKILHGLVYPHISLALRTVQEVRIAGQNVNYVDIPDWHALNKLVADTLAYLPDLMDLDDSLRDKAIRKLKGSISDATNYAKTNAPEASDAGA